MIKPSIPIFIPSYHRPNNIKTLNFFLDVLKYPKELIYVFLDSEADDIEEYMKVVVDKRGCHLVIFDMDDARRKYDFVFRAPKSRRAVGLSRNTFSDFARENNIDFYLVQDDDTLEFLLRPFYLTGLKKILNTAHTETRDLFIECLEDTKDFMIKRHIGVLAWVQGGDLIGGAKNTYSKYPFRYKVMNCTFYNTKYVYKMEKGFQNEDTNAYVVMYNEGYFTGSINNGWVLVQPQSCKSKGGLTEMYGQSKLLSKAICPTIISPSNTIATYQPMNGGRLHHQLVRKYLVPKLIKSREDSKHVANNIAWDTYEEDVPFTNQPKRSDY